MEMYYKHIFCFYITHNGMDLKFPENLEILKFFRRGILMCIQTKYLWFCGFEYFKHVSYVKNIPINYLT